MSVQLESPPVRPRIQSPLPELRENRALAALFKPALARIKPHLRYQEFTRGHRFWDTETLPDQVYFPLSGVISLALDDGDCGGVAVATIGREAALKPGFGTTAIANSYGALACAPASLLANNAELAHIMAKSQDWRLVQAQHLAACNACHSAAARVCRWLLAMLDRLGGRSVPTTQDTIGAELGVRRTTVTAIMGDLRADGLIWHRRERIHIDRRDKIERAACSCYAAALSPASWPFGP